VLVLAVRHRRRPDPFYGQGVFLLRATPVETVTIEPVGWHHGVVGIGERIDGGVGRDHL
jgi:hypothetical protein